MCEFCFPKLPPALSRSSVPGRCRVNSRGEIDARYAYQKPSIFRHFSCWYTTFRCKSMKKSYNKKVFSHFFFTKTQKKSQKVRNEMFEYQKMAIPRGKSPFFLRYASV